MKTIPNRRPSGHDWRPAFLAAYVQTGLICRAASAAGVGRTTVWQAKKDEPAFAAALEEARIVGAQLLEEEATRRARDGVVKLKFFEGRPIMVPCPSGEMQTAADGTPLVDGFGRPVPKMVPYLEHEYSDALMVVLLKRHFPADYRERTDVNHSGGLTQNIVRLDPKEPPR